MIPRFFKDMPPKNRRHQSGEWKLQVIAMFPMKDNIVHSEVYKGKLWRAYVKVRLLAFKKDQKTREEYYGIGWHLMRQD